MAVELKCYANCDDVFMVWCSKTDGKISAIDGCLGFQIEVRNDSAGGVVEILPNLKGFQADVPKTGETRPSSAWPFQTFSWTHHAILHGAVGNQLSYRVTPMIGQPDQLKEDEANASPWVSVVLGASAGPEANAFFNRGVILSQFVSRYAKQHGLDTTQALKRDLTNDVTSPLMQFLSGELGKAIRGIVDTVSKNAKLEIYCALFELDLNDLIEGLIACGGRAHVILANGSVKTAGDDENSKAATQLEGKVDLHRRMTAPHGLAHNKFVVVCEDGQPTHVWTGSTNWTLTGLHTQINNGIALNSAELAQAYFQHWHALIEAGDAFPKTLVTGDDKPVGPFAFNGGSKASVWFTPAPQSKANHNGGADIDTLVNLVSKAQHGILFIMFMPGQEPLDTILKAQPNGLYVRGVVSTLPMGTKGKPSPTFQLLTGEDFKTYALDVVQPQGAEAVGSFVSTFTRQQFLNGMGFAITHSKVIVIDPFGDHPVVVTGSHNLSASASGKNDENLLIIENCPELAKAYAVNCMSVYGHYRWPAYQHDQSHAQAAGADAGYLATTPGWQTTALTDQKVNDLRFWGA
ncbi:phospholipase D-like domain-containing protein [Ralstonia pseudosolanacearum]|uniref:phospholipase D-like domain-containing protein n=1 Tax=Ralstonia pseudosolanacearum TaxID=1310165 RepID=UPI0026774E84|nr:phospholipase D-like domain-containing protein [Ralstonia pseudosolanacearum]MDO3523314.1 phospholipase D-like domain-containing protein [Ralstonia pseudosolanacearum]MDO3545882.1 phospholipase D-like domain-containing protein [Ralstonia pseudosolanacearum]MDO3552917.1 phospholipase D-like domain-containing protein [Ralstonia pseudosolanacearum]MDO3567170.1 phospholipase D-like domain-containing protein [Ralstonia pseudosolanacearum]MDO3579912.1 phospholipase D-like domain-containing protei